MRTESERGARTYDCPRLGRPVVVSYLYQGDGGAGASPRGVQCAGALECGVERVNDEGRPEYDWALCPLRPDLVREGFLPA